MNDEMNSYQTDLLRLMLRSEVLKFGEFKTKSGRLSPYFFNFGAFCMGSQMGALADIYAKFIAVEFPEVENLFGPAYKGIPLAVMTSERLSRQLNREISFSFDRKEIKDHGEGGWLVGHKYSGGEKVVVIEDVITGGTSLRHSLPRLVDCRVNLLGSALGVDRQERGTGDMSSALEIEQAFGVPVKSIVSVEKIVKCLWNTEFLGRIWIDDPMKRLIDLYREKYGVAML
jgi:orotate phosphoribosyltransferase